MAQELFELELEELSLVDRPANAEAKVSLFKRDNSQEEEPMSEETQEQEVDKVDATALQEEIETLKAAKAELETAAVAQTAEVERLTKALQDAEFEVTSEAITKKAPVEEIEIEGVKINKADIPAVVLKALETAAIEKADVALTKRAETELPNFKLAVAKTLLKNLGDDSETIGVLKAADKLFAQLQTEQGEAKSVDMSDPTDKLNALAKAYKTEHSVTFEKAYAAVINTDAGKALYKEMQKKD